MEITLTEYTASRFLVGGQVVLGYILSRSCCHSGTTTRVIYVSFQARCSITNRPFESQSVESLDEVFELEEQHREEYGDHHRLEFELEEESPAPTDRYGGMAALRISASIPGLVAPCRGRADPPPLQLKMCSTLTPTPASIRTDKTHTSRGETGGLSTVA